MITSKRLISFIFSLYYDDDMRVYVDICWSFESMKLMFICHRD